VLGTPLVADFKVFHKVAASILGLTQNLGLIFYDQCIWK